MIRANAVSPTPASRVTRVQARAWAALLAALALTAFVASAPAASAHAKLVSVSPADGSSLATPPRQVVLTFSEDLLASTVKVQVLDGEGVPVADGAPVVSGAVATQPLVKGLSAGGYSVTYRVVSKDGHPVSGSSTFTAKAAAATATPSSPASTSTPPSPSSTSAPSPSTPTTTPSPSTTPEADASAGSGSPAGWVVGGLALVIALAVAVVALQRRRRGPAAPREDR